MGRPKGSRNKPDSGKETERRTESTQGGATGSENQSRLDRFNEIADGADAKRSEELVDIGMPDELEEPDVEKPDDTEGDGDDVENEIVDAVREPITDEYIKRIVNGKEVSHTLNEWLTIASKVEAADEYLHYAAESVRNASRMALSPRDEPEDEDEDDAALARAIQMGSEEEAVQAIRKIKAKPPVQDVSRLVDERLTLRDEKALFEKEYEDVLKDDYLKTLVYEKDAKLSQIDPAKPFPKRWREAANEVREWYKGISGTPHKVDKATRKASVASVPTAAARQAAPQDDDAEETPESVIAGMAKSRGQGRAITH